MSIRATFSVATFTTICGVSLLLNLSTPARADFGVVNANGSYAVDTGAGLVFKVNQTNGDITSLRFNGLEVQGQTKMSHLSSGLGAAKVTETAIGPDIIKISSETPTLTHYFLVRRGINTITMATFVMQEPPVGELRWITRLNATIVPNGPGASCLDGNNGNIESKDVFSMPNGESRSKYYFKERAMDLSIRGATGPGVGVFMDYGNRESSSGGPFFRDIENQQGGDQEVYNYMNSGHNQTEAYRLGVLQGPYALVFTDGKAPDSRADYSWMEKQDLDLQGWVGAKDRGQIKGHATGIPTGFDGLVGFSNDQAQNWCRVDPKTGDFLSPLLKPGSYTMTLYKGELAVASQSVTVNGGAVPAVVNIVSNEPHPTSLWRIGEWDGTPQGFLNAENITIMHPSDVREQKWAPTTYTVGASAPATFPAEQWGEVNPTTIKFDLPAGEVSPLTLRIGISAAYALARPAVTVNTWATPIPEASTQPKSRSLTIGTYRGNNTTFSFDIPANALVAGSNTITINIVGRSNFHGFLSPGFAYDCVEMDKG